ncbi:centrosomal protein of 57 kDa isoform X1 [Lingula anatina]|uniref:Centrosomal protein of 57 kDa isoform X1 n=1 Tax=Lingula anatina TaxID=7574 RepID=A0A1S3IZC5_LINAN|nr:centrosomal protein of 57 kDa isoform X1 [Lingula anatina]|eukprot:XP_013403341.1 centrosomal protein of 57 kDa isoform X1 [Lingula anatina]
MASLYSPTRPSAAYSSYRSPLRPGMYTNYRDRSMVDDTSTVHGEYPPTRPFINTDYTRSPAKPVSALPENDRQGSVMGALKSLQDKIRKLELERCMAEGNLKNLASETSRYRDMLQREQMTQDAATATAVSRQSQELESQLTAAESRCNLLEKQLEYMRKMVQNAEKDKEMAVHRHTMLDRRKEEDLQAGLQSQLDKIAELEREHLRLTATQSLAENKIRGLEERLQEEQHQRKLIQERAAELQTAAETNRILLEAVSPQHSRAEDHKPTAKRKKKKTTAKKSTASSQKPPVDPTNHYRLNLNEIPFVAGKAVTPSHALGANVQQVLSLMKKHNPSLCAAARKNGLVRRSTASASSAYTGSSSEEGDLAELMVQLQDEFAQMSFEHQELLKQINEARDYRLREDLERELDHLVARMEAKGDQIARLKKHQENLQELRLKKKKKKPRPQSAPPSQYTTNGSSSGEVQVTTTIKTKGHGAGKIHAVPTAGTRAALNLLKDMRKLQTSLRKDDLSWE